RLRPRPRLQQRRLSSPRRAVRRPAIGRRTRASESTRERGEEPHRGPAFDGEKAVAGPAADVRSGAPDHAPAGERVPAAAERVCNPDAAEFVEEVLTRAAGTLPALGGGDRPPATM